MIHTHTTHNTTGDKIKNRHEINRELDRAVVDRRIPERRRNYWRTTLREGGTQALVALRRLEPVTLSASAPPSDRVVCGPSGRLSYKGLPASIGPDGSPRVHTSAGEMTVETIKTLGIDVEAERVLHASRARMGEAA